MKKIILIGVLIASQYNTIRAQETDSRDNLAVGLKAGANYSNVYDEQGDAFVADPKFGLAAGAFIAIPIGKYLGLQPEILLSQKGFQASGSILGSNYNLKRTTTYVDVPLLFAFKPIEFFTLLAGPQYSYLINQKDVYSSGTTSIEQQKDFANENLRRNIFCFTGGADITIKHIVIGARAGWDIQNNNGDGTSANPRYKNMWYQATFGYRFYSRN
ncbi:MAG: porin family protein [Bacteroidota bacterium]|nr:porin family protein [Bacteroidota bacterium]